MQRILQPTILALVSAAMMQATSLGDEAPPERPAPKKRIVDVAVRISHDPRSKINRLIIPRRLLDNARPDRVGAAGTGIRTIIAGLAMSIGIASLVLLKNQRGRVKIAVATIVAFAAVFVIYEIAIADVAPPPYWEFNGGTESRDFQIELVEDGRFVQLIWGKAPYQGSGGDNQPDFDGAEPPEPSPPE